MTSFGTTELLQCCSVATPVIIEAISYYLLQVLKKKLFYLMTKDSVWKYVLHNNCFALLKILLVDPILNFLTLLGKKNELKKSSLESNPNFTKCTLGQPFVLHKNQLGISKCFWIHSVPEGSIKMTMFPSLNFIRQRRI